jgi:hypothetical protein
MLRTAAEHAYASTSAGLVLLGAASVLAALVIVVFVRQPKAAGYGPAEPAKAS